MKPEPMRCGNCGGSEARVTAVGSGFYTELTLTCVGCGSSTVFAVEPARIKASWGKGAQGVFCTGWGEPQKRRKR